MARFRPFLPPQLSVFPRPSSLSALECALTKNTPVTPLDSALTETPGVGGLSAPSHHSPLVYPERSSRRATRHCPFVFSGLQTLFLSLRSFSHPDPLFSTTSALFLQNTRGGIPLRKLVRCTEAQKCLSASPLFATLTHSVSRKSFPCHSYENIRDGGITSTAELRTVNT